MTGSLLDSLETAHRQSESQWLRSAGFQGTALASSVVKIDQRLRSLPLKLFLYLFVVPRKAFFR